jgi:hypothetical protein
VLDEYVGEYKLPTGEVFHARRSENGLAVSLGEMSIGSVVPAARDVFFREAGGESRLVFVRDESGNVRWVQLRRHPSWGVRARKVK